MQILVVDTETTGLPINNKASIMNLENWPYIIQLSYIIYDIKNNILIKCQDYIIKLDKSVIISKKSEDMHKISREKSEKYGISIIDVLNQLQFDIKNVDIIVGHNLEFDKKMILVESKRNNIDFSFSTYSGKTSQLYCTMRNSINLCKLPLLRTQFNNYSPSYKYPKLEELIFFLFKDISVNFHNSLIDVLYTLRAYCKIVNDIDIFLINDEIQNLVTNKLIKN